MRVAIQLSNVFSPDEVGICNPSFNFSSMELSFHSDITLGYMVYVSHEKSTPFIYLYEIIIMYEVDTYSSLHMELIHIHICCHHTLLMSCHQKPYLIRAAWHSGETIKYCAIWYFLVVKIDQRSGWKNTSVTAMLTLWYNVTVCYPLTCGDRVISVWLCQYHGCWCPGSLRRQDISSHDIDYVQYVSPGLTWGRILSTCVISMWINGLIYKMQIYVYVPSEKFSTSRVN